MNLKKRNLLIFLAILIAAVVFYVWPIVRITQF